jgi:hypothetical protein
MAKQYVNETQTVRWEMWDRRISPEKPDREESPNDPAWLSGAQVSEIIVTVTYPDKTQEVFTLTDGDVEPTDRPGEWRFRILLDKGKGKYLIDIEGRTSDDYRPVDLVLITAEARKA